MTDDYLWLLPTVQMSVDDDALQLRRGTTSLSFTGRREQVVAALRQLDGSCSERELLRSDLHRRILPLLETEAWLVRLEHPLSEVLQGRPAASRQLSYFAHLQQRHPDTALTQLQEARVLVIGAGGIGSHMAQSLAGAGVGKLCISDPDLVEPSNLNRQFFYSSADVGRPKVEVAAEYLSARHPTLEVETLPRNIFADDEPGERIDEFDLIAFCGDGDTLGTFADRVGTKPVLIAGYQGSLGQIGPFVWPKLGTACWSCMLEATGASTLRACERGRVGRANAWNSSGSAMNGLLGNLASEVAVRSLAPALGPPLLVNSLLVIDMDTLESSRMSMPEIACPHRGHLATSALQEERCQ